MVKILKVIWKLIWIFSLMLNGVDPYAETKYHPEDIYEDAIFTDDTREYLFDACERYNLDPYILMGQIELESSFNPNAIGDGGDSIGYLQIQPKWWSHLIGDRDLKNPKDNIAVGIIIMDYYMRTYDNDIRKALMCYNMGEQGAKECWDLGIYETSYVKIILGNAEKIKNTEEK